MILNLLKYHKYSLIFLLSCGTFYFSFAYDLVRTDFIKLIALYAGLFFLSWKLIQLEKFNINFLLGAAILFRLLFLFSIPNLSQDFYRFIWDGKLLLEGVNPYLFSPNALFNSLDFEGFPASFQTTLLEGMGTLSAGNHSNYPPLNQLFFAGSALFSETGILGPVIFMRIVIIFADIGVFYFGRKLLKSLNLPENRIFRYLLNPLIIIELTGNLHFEGVLIFFLLWSLFLLKNGKWFRSAVLLACAVSIKLIPLLFLPLFFKKLKPKKAILYYTVVGGTCLLFFVPFLSWEVLQYYFQTTALWFQQFEFNASFYYFFRWLGFEIKGYNIIATVGKVLAVLVFLFVIFLAFFRRNKTISGLLSSMLFAISFYYFMATTVHPWYLAVPVVLCVFTKYRFPLLWSFLVILSYQAYSNNNFHEKLWLVAIEYIAVFGLLLWEFVNRKQIGN